MITKRNFDPLKVWGYIKGPLSLTLVWSLICWAGYTYGGLKSLALPFQTTALLGSALAIFVAFRNNSAYGRWWEARQIWGGIVNASRVLTRLVITFADSHAHQENYVPEKSQTFKKEMVYLLISWVHAMRFQLRDQDQYGELRQYLNDDEFQRMMASSNKPNILAMLMGQKIYQAMSNGTLAGFDSFQLEGQLLALVNLQGSAERIKNTPLPRQYDYFTRVFVLLFALILPPGLLSLFSTGATLQPLWIIVPLSLIIAGVFVVMERTGAANEDPFENKVTDIPLTALCNNIERDVLEMLGERELNRPAKMVPENGYLL